MKRGVALLIVVAYVGFVFTSTTLLPLQLWPIAVASFFLGAALSKGRIWVALFVVATLTLLLPVGMLLFMGQSTYGSMGATLDKLLEASLEHGQLGGFEWFVPLLSAGVGALLSNRMRSNKALQPTGPASGGPGG